MEGLIDLVRHFADSGAMESFLEGEGVEEQKVVPEVVWAELEVR